VKNPQSAWKEFAVGRFKTGDIIRSGERRFSAYRDRKGRITGAMLDDHQSDKDENTNVVGQSVSRMIAEGLAKQLAVRNGK